MSAPEHPIAGAGRTLVALAVIAVGSLILLSSGLCSCLGTYSLLLEPLWGEAPGAHSDPLETLTLLGIVLTICVVAGAMGYAILRAGYSILRRR